MIQDIFPHKLNNHYRPDARPEKSSRVLCYTEDGLLCRLTEETHELQLPVLSDFSGAAASPTSENLTYLFSVDEEDFFLLFPEQETPLRGEALPQGEALPREETLPQEKTLPQGYAYLPVRKLRALASGPKELIFAVLTGLQLYNWYRNNRYCGRCGGRTIHEHTERAIRCPACNHLIYPRIVPAVIVGVLSADGKRLLLTKYRTGFAHYALVAGFTEIGETLEETVAREVMEETGLPVRAIRYYKSQPWGIVDDLLAGFYCNADDSKPIRMDESELKLAEWKTREEIVLQPDDFSLTNEMMMRFKQGLPC